MSLSLSLCVVSKRLTNFVVLLGLIFILSGCDNTVEDSNAQSGTAQLNSVSGTAQLGYISDGQVKLFKLPDLNNEIATTKTSSSNELTEAGGFIFTDISINKDKFYLLEISEGNDIDPNDDGRIEVDQKIALQGTVYALAKGSDLISGDTRVNALTDIAYQKIKNGLTSLSNEQISAFLKKNADEFVYDINGDGIINNKDILLFNPIEHSRKVKQSYQDILDVYIAKVHSGAVEEKKLSSLMYVNPPRIVIGSGSLQEIPFNLNANIENPPLNLTVKWFLNSVEKSEIDESITDDGIYHVEAWLYKGTTLLKVIEKSVIATHKVEIATIEADVSKDNEIKVTISDAGSSSLAGTQVFIPQGALSENTKITIKKSSINSIPNSKGASISDVIVMEPAGLIFEKPIQIRIPYDETVDIGNSSVRVARYSEGGGLDYIKPLFIDRTSHEVVFETSHFTSFQAEKYLVGKSADEKFVDNLNTEFSLNKSIQDWEPILNTYIDITAKKLTVYDYLLTYFENKKLYEIIENSDSNQRWGADALNSLYPNSSEVGRNFDMWDGVKDGFEVIDQLQGISSELVKIDKGEIYTGLLNALGLPTDAGGFNPHKYKPTEIATNIVKSFNDAQNHTLVQYIINNSKESNAESADTKCALDDDIVSYIDKMSDVQGIKWMAKSVCTRYQAYKMMLDNPSITDDLNNKITPKFEATSVLNSVIDKILAEETEEKYKDHPVSEFVDKHYVQNPLLINSEVYKNISIPIKIATKGYEGLGDFVPSFELYNIETGEVDIKIAIGEASNVSFQKLDNINGKYTAIINFKSPRESTNYILRYELDRYFRLIDDKGSSYVNVAVTLPPIKAKITGVSIVDKLLENGDYQFHLEAQFDSGNYPVVIECSLGQDCTKDIIISSSDFDLPKLNDLSVSIRPTDEVSQYFVEPNYATNIDMQPRISEVEAEGYLDLTSPFIGDGPGTLDRPNNFSPIAKITVFDGVVTLSNVLVGVEAPLMLDATKSSDSDGSIVSYEWTEGSMLLSKESVFTKTDFSSGEHTVSLTVKDSDGATATDTVTVRVFEFKQALISTDEETTQIVYQHGGVFLKIANSMTPSIDIPYTVTIKDRANFGSNMSKEVTLSTEGGVTAIDITDFINRYNLKYKVIEVYAWGNTRTLDKLRFFIDYDHLYDNATIAKLVLNDTIKNKDSENSDNTWPNKAGEEENNSLNTTTHRIIDFDKIVYKKINFGNEFWEKSVYVTQTKDSFIEASDTRKPLLLIHGWQGDIGQTEPAKMLMYDNNEFEYWHNVISYYLATPELHNNYKLYTYHYPSYKHITFNARMLKKLLLDKLPSNSPLAKGVNNSGVVIVGHSMGGLIARSLIEEYTALGTNAERLIKLITLDTPHHGSPSTLTSIIRVDLVNGLAKDLETPGAVDLLWDNYNQHFTCNPLGTVVCEHLLSATIQTKDGDSRYRKLLDEGQFDTHYSSLNNISGFGLGSGGLNPWLTNLNGVFAEKYTKPTQYTDKYVFYVAFTSPAGSDWIGLYNTLENDTFGMHANTDLINFHGYASGGAEPVSSAFLSKSPEVDKVTKFFPNTGDVTTTSQKPEKYIDINNLGDINNYNIPYRVFWDYNHERIMNGAYIDKGDWDTFIDKGKQEKVNTCQLTVFKSINTAGPCNTARNQYVDLALEYLYQGTNSLTITDKTNSESNNPLKTEPVFLILQRDLLDSLSHSSPIANAGVDKNVMEGESVLFDASLSTADGGIKSYEWSKEGAILALTPSFTKNNDLLQGNLSVGTHTFTLRITNFFNETSTDTVNINVIGSIVIHNGLEYGAVSSPFTGKIWLDRNLGASQFCISLNDTACYGGYYQWGRSTDGHEQKTSATTSVQAADINNAGSKMVVNWTDWFAADSDGSLRGAKWSEIDGNSICPSGYRVPTVEEFEAEIISNSINNNTNAFNSFLKMPSSGLRNSFDGSFSDLGASSNYWVSSTSGSQSVAINIYSTGTSIFNTYRTQGLAVRCIKSNT